MLIFITLLLIKNLNNALVNVVLIAINHDVVASNPSSGGKIWFRIFMTRTAGTLPYTNIWFSVAGRVMKGDQA